MAISHDPLEPRIGAAAHGVVAGRGVAAAEARQILGLLERHGVVAFAKRRVELAGEEAIA